MSLNFGIWDALVSTFGSSMLVALIIVVLLIIVLSMVGVDNYYSLILIIPFIGAAFLVGIFPKVIVSTVLIGVALIILLLVKEIWF